MLELRRPIYLVVLPKRHPFASYYCKIYECISKDHVKKIENYLYYSLEETENAFAQLNKQINILATILLETMQAVETKQTTQTRNVLKGLKVFNKQFVYICEVKQSLCYAKTES